MFLCSNIAVLAFGHVSKYIPHKNSTFLCTQVCVFLKVFSPEDSGPAPKSGFLQSFETHQKESQQPQRQEHQHQISEVNREVHWTER